MIDFEPTSQSGRPWLTWGPEHQRNNLIETIGEELYEWLEEVTHDKDRDGDD